ncbi:tyrosine-protein phosphatase [Frankia sp. AgB1.9]|uniref:tyrosine-protein phosphatase n=1 Tax=unclassified Frankia TaxID=2632575 RepID=UPI0019330E74|nr:MULTISPECIES: tyrosine-protein phosphatase [unclassified Frankia]MBL7490193.1 tyrosine-protein phosphatase [Frankia sp. AgW1.1]MBL7553382.1 tyrosine-protein phosphatase [Frankia sp. AgB1.9]MBL7619407.1 tyrosine-protein phosphatase [Frankia sp. AgB1.8]
MDRWYELEGCDNVRDLGGLPTVDGGQTQYGVLLRSDTLQHLSPAGVLRLRDDYGLRTILDLRTPEEATREGRGPLGDEAIAYHNLSFLRTRWLMPAEIAAEEEAALALIRIRTSDDRVEHYLDYLRLAGDSVSTAIGLIADEANGPTLFHCAAGKDRTGVLAAVVLSIVGVEREAIIEDYLATNDRIHLIETRLSALPSYERGIRTRADVDQLRVRPEVMAGVLERVDQTWGDAAGWARQAGLSDESITALRSRLVANNAD